MDAGSRHRLLAILAADAAGYSRLMAADERATVAALDAAREVFAQQVLAHAGRIVDTAGDSVLAVFETAAGALDAALAIQEQMAVELTGIPPERQMRFRIGVHLGDVIEKSDGSVYGNGVNVAARLQSLAEPGGIWISDSVRGAIGAHPGRRFEDRGRQAVKNIAEPVHAFRLHGVDPLSPRSPRRTMSRGTLIAVGGTAIVGIALALALWVLPLARSGSSTSPGASEGLIPLSLMLGPITATAGDARGAEVAERLRSDLGAGLSGPAYRSSYTVLTARNAAPSGASEPPLEQARRAGARLLLEGSIRRDDEGHVATLQIVETPSGAQKWSSTIGLKAADSVGVRASTVQQMVNHIGNYVFASEGRRVLALPVDQLAPVELLVRSNATYDAKPNRQGIDEALKLAELALARNPNFVPVLNMKVFMLLNRYDEETSPDHDSYAQELDALTARALALDARDPHSWNLRTFALLFTGRWASAMEAVDKFVEIAGLFYALTDKANTLIYLGQPRQALELLAAGPVGSSPTWEKIVACHAQILLGDAKAAVTECERAVGRDPSLWSAHLYLAAAHANVGELEAARASLAVVDRMSPAHSIARLRNYRYAAHPEYRRLADAHYYAGLRKAGMPEK